MELLKPRDILDDRGLKHVFVARRLRITPSYLSLLLAGKRAWTDVLKRRFAELMEMPVEAINWETQYVFKRRRAG